MNPLKIIETTTKMIITIAYEIKVERARFCLFWLTLSLNAHKIAITIPAIGISITICIYKYCITVIAGVLLFLCAFNCFSNSCCSSIDSTVVPQFSQTSASFGIFFPHTSHSIYNTIPTYSLFLNIIIITIKFGKVNIFQTYQCYSNFTF